MLCPAALSAGHGPDMDVDGDYDAVESKLYGATPNQEVRDPSIVLHKLARRCREIIGSNDFVK